MRCLPFLAIFIALVSACTGNELLEILPNDSVRKTSWESRSIYRPYGKKIDGIPIRDINKKWCAANLLSLEQFPLEAKKELTSVFQEFNFAFNIDDLEVEKFGRARASVGVADFCNEGVTRFFLIITTHNKLEPLKIAFLQEFGEVDIVIIKKLDNETIWAGFCIACDIGADLTWKNGKFKWVEIEMGG